MASRVLRWTARIVGGLVAVALVAAVAIYVISGRVIARTYSPPPRTLAAITPAMASEGHRRLYTAGCVSCHGEGLIGQKFDTPDFVVNLHTPNVPLRAATMSDAELDRAIRQGVAKDGHGLIIMPSRVYQFLTDAEAASMIAAIRALPRTGEAQPAPRFGPVGRMAVATGQLLPMPELLASYRERPLPDLGPATAAGRHLVQTACAECHGADLKGQEVSPGVVAPDLSMAGAYDGAQFRTLLRTGVPPSGKDLGLMKEVSTIDFSHMTDAEIDAVHAYLRAYADR